MGDWGYNRSKWSYGPLLITGFWAHLVHSNNKFLTSTCKVVHILKSCKPIEIYHVFSIQLDISIDTCCGLGALQQMQDKLSGTLGNAATKTLVHLHTSATPAIFGSGLQKTPLLR